MQQPQAVLIHPQLPPEVLAFLENYLLQIGEGVFLFALSFESEGSFVVLEALRNDKSKKTWVVRLPVQYILATADATDKESSCFGFLSQ
jgi:hypothetical protein